MTAIAQQAAGGRARRMLNKVPEVTFYFWVIKIMCTTVGETAADYLNVNLGFGLTNTTIVAGVSTPTRRNSTTSHVVLSRFIRRESWG